MKEATLLTLLIFCIFHFCIAQISKCRQGDGGADIDWVILYKPPGEKRGKILVAAAAAWAAYPQDLHNAAESVSGTHANKHFFAYNNVAPGVVGVKTKSNSKGVVILDTTAQTDAAAWIVHTVPGYPKPKATYTFPESEYANGHLLICLTIAESQIEPIAAALFMASPFIHYNDVPEAEVKTRPTLRKLLNGEAAIMPPFSTKQNIGTQAAPSVPVQIFSKSGRSKYEIYHKIISKQLKKTIKVWSRRDKKLKANCKIRGRQILLVSSPISVDGQASSTEKDVTNWLIPENGDIFCSVDKPYVISQKYEPAVAVCIQLANIFALFNTIAAKLRHQNAKELLEMQMAILYKPPGEKRGKILVAPGGAWASNPVDLENPAGHSFAKALEHVAGTHANIKFFAYNNAAPGVVGVKTKSNSKGVLILDITGTDSAAWIVHTVPGYPKPKATYTFPASEYANGHLLLCLTIAESQIEPIAAALLMASPFIHYNDVPGAEVNTRAALKKLINGETAIKPPFITKQNIATQGGPAIPVQVFSKSERSKYEIYHKIISKQLKKTIKVWSRRDKKLKANCKIRGRQILLVSNPISVDGQASSSEKDVANWLIPENGDIFCSVDKPYAISQKYEPAVAVCIQQAIIFERFNTIAAKCPNIEMPSGSWKWGCRLHRIVLYKPPGDKRGKILVSPGGAWQAIPQDLDNAAGHSFAKALESVVGAHGDKKFFAYNNAASGVTGVKTKSNSKDTTAPTDAAAWIVHTVPGYPKPKVAYTFPASEYANGHLLLCLTIAESQIEPIAVALFMASPFIHYNDVPDAEVRSRPTLKKLLNGETPIMPPFLSKQAIKTQANPSVTVQIFSKSERSKYEGFFKFCKNIKPLKYAKLLTKQIYQKIISKQLKKTIKVWSRRDKKLKANCKIRGRQILLVSNPISVDGQASSLEKDVANWLIPENGDIFCAVDKPYAISQKYEPAVAVCIQQAIIFERFNTIAANVDPCLLYKPPGDKRGKILVPAGGAWAANPQDLENAADHSFAKALESVVGNHPAKKFFAYNNAASGAVGIKTKSNSKDTTAPTDAAAWIVHTVPGYPKPKVAYTFPASEYANGHLLLCLTIAESQIEPIAVALFMASPFIHYNDVPDAEVRSRPTLKKLLNGETPIMPPFLSKQAIKTQANPSVTVQIFSKSERSKYEIYQKIISKQLKKTIKVWSRRDKKLKANCKIRGRQILLVSNPISVDGQASSLEKDVANWLIPENGDIFCAVDKPYAISQKYEPAVAVCIQQAIIFERFNTIAANVDPC
ncbi:Plancitoxin-1, partial [Trichinella pseudospiralis]